MPIIGSELIPNAEEEQEIRKLIFAWRAYDEATRNMRKIAERARPILFPMEGRNTIRSVTVTVDRIRYQLWKENNFVRVTKVEG